MDNASTTGRSLFKPILEQAHALHPVWHEGPARVYRIPMPRPALDTHVVTHCRGFSVYRLAPGLAIPPDDVWHIHVGEALLQLAGPRRHAVVEEGRVRRLQARVLDALGAWNAARPVRFYWHRFLDFARDPDHRPLLATPPDSREPWLVGAGRVEARGRLATFVVSGGPMGVEIDVLPPAWALCRVMGAWWLRGGRRTAEKLRGGRGEAPGTAPARAPR